MCARPPVCLCAVRAIAVWFFDAMKEAASLTFLSCSLARSLALSLRDSRTAPHHSLHSSFVPPISCMKLIRVFVDWRGREGFSIRSVVRRGKSVFKSYTLYLVYDEVHKKVLQD